MYKCQANPRGARRRTAKPALPPPTVASLNDKANSSSSSSTSTDDSDSDSDGLNMKESTATKALVKAKDAKQKACQKAKAASAKVKEQKQKLAAASATIKEKTGALKAKEHELKTLQKQLRKFVDNHKGHPISEQYRGMKTMAKNQALKGAELEKVLAKFAALQVKDTVTHSATDQQMTDRQTAEIEMNYPAICKHYTLNPQAAGTSEQLAAYEKLKYHRTEALKGSEKNLVKKVKDSALDIDPPIVIPSSGWMRWGKG